MTTPNNKFSAKDLATLNKVSYEKAKNFIDSQVNTGNLIHVENVQVAGRGRPTAFYKKKNAAN